MPKSKRNKSVHLTKVKAKGRSQKEKLIQKIQDTVGKYNKLFVFEYKNMTTKPFREIQAEWADSKFFLGKNKVMQLALGREVDTELLQNLHQMSKHLKGFCGILCTNRSLSEVLSYFGKMSVKSYTVGGSIASETITLRQGFDHMANFSHSMEPHLRKLGLATKLDNEKIYLLKDHVLCTEGNPITVENAKILKLLEIKTDAFSIKILSYWSQSGEFSHL